MPDGRQKEIDSISDLLKTRNDPMNNPVTFLGWSLNEDDISWMVDFPMDSQLNYYGTYTNEKRSILENHGEAIPFTEGFHIAMCLVGSIETQEFLSLH